MGAGPSDPLYVFCADVMSGRQPEPSAVLAAHSGEALLEVIQREGVVSLVHAHLTDPAYPYPLPAAVLDGLAQLARMAAARHLLASSEVGRIQTALAGAAIPALWMKGVALSQWLYSSPHLRDVADIDLLLPDHATTLRAARILAPLGYELPNPHIAGDLVVHELLAWSARAQLELDLHWDLSNDALFAGRLPWNALAASAIALPQLADTARGLAPEHALLHACMHRALNYLTARQDRLRWLYDIHLMAILLDAAQWQRVEDTAIEAGLADPCADALRASRRVFATPVPEITLQGLEAAAAKEPLRSAQLRDWRAMQLATWRHLADLRSRLRWLRQLMFPDIAHLRVRYGADGAGPVRLLARRLFDGWKRWRGYHRVVG